MGMFRPVTWWREKVLSGAVPWEEASPAVRSWLRKDIYDGALEIAGIEYIEDRRAALGKLPVSIRPLVEAELKRIWAMGRSPIR